MNYLEPITPSHWSELIPTESPAIIALVLAAILFVVGIYKVIAQYRQNAQLRRERSHRLTVDFGAYKQREGEGRSY